MSSVISLFLVPMLLLTRAKPDQTPTTDADKNSVDIIVTPNWKIRALDSEHKLSIERKKSERAERMVRKLRGQIDEYCEALNCSTQDHRRMISQYQALSNANLGLCQELQKAKVMVETLEAVLMMFYTHPSAKEISQTHQRLTGRAPPGEDRPDSADA